LKGGPRHKQKVSFQKMVDKKNLFETKNAKFVSFQKMVDKKNLFETKNASHFLSGLHFLFQKGFFCQPFFEKIQGLGFPELFQRKTAPFLCFC